MTRLHVLTASCCSILVLCAGCDSSSNRNPAGGTVPPKTESGLVKIRLELNWFPEAEHGGYYEAQQRGFYEDEGLDVEIVPGGPGAPVIQQTARGSTQFAVANADQVILGRAQGAKVQAIFAPIAESPRCIVVREESGIKSLEDLKDLTLAMNEGRAFAEFLKAKVPLENVRIVPYDGSLTLFLRGQDFAVQGYEFSEPYVARQQGARVRTLPLRMIGFNVYASLLITSDQFAAENPDILKKMVRASRRGWKAYLKDPIEVNRHLSSLNPEISIDALRFGAEAILPLAKPDQADFGDMPAARWETLVSQLEEIKLIEPGKVQAIECFSNPLVPMPQDSAQPAPDASAETAQDDAAASNEGMTLDAPSQVDGSPATSSVRNAP